MAFPRSGPQAPHGRGRLMGFWKPVRAWGWIALAALALWFALAAHGQPDVLRPNLAGPGLAAGVRNLGKPRELQTAGGQRSVQAQAFEQENGSPCSDLVPSRLEPARSLVRLTGIDGYECPGLAFQWGWAVDGSRPRPPPGPAPI